ncbi:MAG: hypothetical protein MJY66_00370 [Bacteroidaceae bacterium]|nr:hypothetical protein [Bacteroidaceae bacterium]
MKARAIILSGIVILMAMSCSKDPETAPAPAQGVTSGAVSEIYPFCATASGTLTGFKAGELAFGDAGFLLTAAGAGAAASFKTWQEEGRAAGVKVFHGSASGETYQVVLKDLDPGTQYACCAFFTLENGTRYIGDVITFSTSELSPEALTLDNPAAGFMDVTVRGAVNTDKTTLSKCTYGAIISQSGEPTVDNGTLVQCKSTLDGNNEFSVSFDYLYAGTVYKYRTYVMCNGSCFYGEVKEFSTRNADELAVDLGLSVLWSSSNLGARAENEEGLCFAWGCLKCHNSGMSSDYPYFDKEGREFVNIPEDITGNPEYDAAAKYLGGKWRMPTIEEFEELFNNCTSELVRRLVNGAYYEDDAYIWHAGNGNSIRMQVGQGYAEGIHQAGVQYWSGQVELNLNGELKPWAFEMSGVMRNLHTDPYREYPIRPVRDR